MIAFRVDSGGKVCFYSCFFPSLADYRLCGNDCVAQHLHVQGALGTLLEMDSDAVCSYAKGQVLRAFLRILVRPEIRENL